MSANTSSSARRSLDFLGGRPRKRYWEGGAALARLGERVPASPADRPAVRDGAGTGFALPWRVPGRASPCRRAGPARPAKQRRRRHRAPLPEPRDAQRCQQTASDADRIVATIARSIPLEKLELPEEFFPAHLSVGARRRRLPGPVPGAGTTPRRAPSATAATSASRAPGARRWKTPPASRQETLGELIAHFRDIGLERMKREVFGARQRLPGTGMARAEYVMHAAKALRCLGVDVPAGHAFAAPGGVRGRPALTVPDRQSNRREPADVHERRRLRPG